MQALSCRSEMSDRPARYGTQTDVSFESRRGGEGEIAHPQRASPFSVLLTLHQSGIHSDGVELR